MVEHRDVVIVGASLSGANCAIAAREAGYEGSIALLGDETHVPYSRPGLTKAVLRGEKPVESTFVQEGTWYADNDVDLRTGCLVTGVDVEERQARTTVGDFSYGTLVLATGATPRHLDVEGGSHRISVIRKMEDCLTFRRHLATGARLLVIGGGYIGVESAASALELGCEVDLVMQEQVLWEQMYGPVVGGYFERKLKEHGARVHPADAVTRLEDYGDGIRATLKSGDVIEADWALAGIGVTPNLKLARDAGLETDTGVLVDEHLRASAPDVYAVGDIAQYDSVMHGKRLRIEHWDVARNMGRYVGEQIAGVSADPYRVTPYFFSGLGDWMFMRYVGPGSGDLVVRGSMDDDAFAAVYVRDGKLAACLTVNRDEDLEAARELLGAPVNANTLGDSDASIRSAVTKTPH